MNKKLIFVFVALLITAYFAGRFSAPEKIEIDKTKDVMISELERQLKSKTTDAVQVTTTIIKPDGTHYTQTRVENRVITVTVHDTEDKKEDKETEHKVITNRKGVVVSALVGIGLKNISDGVVYGVSIQKQVLGPLNVGAFGFNDARLGVSLGFEF